MREINEAMLIDFYELTMAYGYFKAEKKETVYFDLFFRSIPDNGGYAFFAGLETIINYIDNLSFTEKDIAYLRKRELFDESFLSFLLDFEFSGTVYSVKEGTIIFPNEPILTIEAPIIEAQLLETFLLQTVNHQSLIATKASRIKRAAKDCLVLEMGARRAHGVSSSIEGARAAYIGGVDATSNVLADQLYGIKALGTMAHSWVQLFDSEYEAFKAYAKTYPDNSTLLVDTYDTLNKGIPNAIKVIKEILLPKNVEDYAIRIDSGDLTYLTKKARKMLDDAGLDKCKIVVSNSLDEYSIEDLLKQGAPIDIFGVGERLITAKSDPVFGAVYKLVAAKKNGTLIPKIKLSENIDKIITPSYKKLYRVYDKKQTHALADLITLQDETINENEPLTLFDPNFTWKTKTIEKYQLEPLQTKIYNQGSRVYDYPALEDIKTYTKQQLNTIWDEVKRFNKPHKYYVDLSQKLWDLKQKLMNK
ncbi:MAG: nicotinate phosphoribosyltransferase [Candidatus Izimaplasma sp.]|nr:nicotinate phosphoribosyltransferase [Candidatus Izimaplasma bacterium]